MCDSRSMAAAGAALAGAGTLAADGFHSSDSQPAEAEAGTRGAIGAAPPPADGAPWLGSAVGGAAV